MSKVKALEVDFVILAVHQGGLEVRSPGKAGQQARFLLGLEALFPPAGNEFLGHRAADPRHFRTQSLHRGANGFELDGHFGELTRTRRFASCGCI